MQNVNFFEKVCRIHFIGRVLQNNPETTRTQLSKCKVSKDGDFIKRTLNIGCAHNAAELQSSL